MTTGVQTLTFLLVGFALCWVGKIVFGWTHPRVRTDAELTARDNVAFAVPLGAYYLGILIVVGAPLSGNPVGILWRDALGVAGWGLLAILLLTLAARLQPWLLFPGLDLLAEIVDHRNLAAGVVMGGLYLANALLILGALGDEGGLVPAAVFWLYGQALLTLAARTFVGLVHEDLPAELRRENLAVALGLAGAMVAMGNVLRLAISGTFLGWAAGLAASTGYALAGLALLFGVRWLLDWLLLPGVTIRQEVVEQAVPNTGVGYLEALFYIGTSLLIGWTL
jgi:uncharacterized membrane protein YjfL (UPF0719 family)